MLENVESEIFDLRNIEIYIKKHCYNMDSKKIQKMSFFITAAILNSYDFT